MITTFLFCIITHDANANPANGDTIPSPGQTPAPIVDFSILPATASIRPMSMGGTPQHVHAHLIAEQQQILPGSSLRLGVYLEQDEGWHTYWKSPGEIGQATRVDWTVPQNVQISDIEFPVPTYFHQSNMTSYGYDGGVLLISQMQIPSDISPGTHNFGAHVEWLVCKESCIPGSVDLELPLEIAGSAVDSAFKPLFDHTQNLHPRKSTDTPELTVTSVLSDTSIAINSPFTFSLQINRSDGQPIEVDESHLWPTFTPISGTYYFTEPPKLTKTSDGAFIIQMDGETFEAESYPFHDRIGALIQIPIDDTWVRSEIIVDLPIVEQKETLINTEPASVVPDDLQKPSQAPEMSLLQALFFAFFGGMLLNIMPCVLPVITLKLFGLVEQSDITPRQQRISGMAYTAGIIASFLALATVIIVLQSVFGLNVGWGFQFQYPEYVIALATLVFVFGLSLLGVFEIPVLGAGKAHEMSQKDGWMEYFMIGVFATFLATPCSAPFLGTGIGFAFTLPPWGILTFFAIAGLGLAFPFLLVAFIPAFFKLLPKPGAWMETFKQILGFTLLGTTVWLVDVLGAQTGQEGTTGFLIFAVFVGLGAWIFGKWGSVIATQKSQLLSFLTAVGISTIAGFLFLKTDFAKNEIPQDIKNIADLNFDEHIPWQPFSDANIQQLKTDKKPIFIDFTADWCLSCKANERTVLESESVRQAMKTHGIIPVKADWTRRDEAISAWLKNYGKAGVPFYLVIHKDGSTTPLPEVLTAQLVIDALGNAAK